MVKKVPGYSNINSRIYNNSKENNMTDSDKIRIEKLLKRYKKELSESQMGPATKENLFKEIKYCIGILKRDDILNSSLESFNALYRE